MSDPLPVGVIPPPPRWLARRANRRLIGRLLVAITAGVISGILLAQSEAGDLRLGKTLTKERYAADFEAHRSKLLDSDPSVPVDVFAFVLVMLALAALYEGGGILIAPAVGWADDAFARRATARRGHVLDDTDL